MVKEIATKKALPMMGTLEAVFKFRVYRNRRRPKDYIMHGYNTTSNCARYRNSMMRDAHYNAKTALFNMIGGSYTYISNLLDYIFYYNASYSKGKKGKVYSLATYESNIPDVQLSHRKSKTDKKTKAYPKKQFEKEKKAQNILRGRNITPKNEKYLNKQNNKTTKTQTKNNIAHKHNHYRREKKNRNSPVTTKHEKQSFKY